MERWVPCKSSQLSHASDPYVSDRIQSQGGEKINSKGTWQTLETLAKSSDNKTATNEDNAFAETMNLETVRSERNADPGKRFYSEAVKRRNNENYERSKPWENQPVEE